MAGQIYQDGLWVSQGDPRKVNEQQTAFPTDSVDAGAVRQFVAGQLGKEINLPNPTNASSLYPVTYKYVRRYTSDAVQNAPYNFVQWQDIDDFVVQQGTAVGVPAGVSFWDDDAASTLDRGIQVGKFGYIQVGGVSLIKCGAGVVAGDALMAIAAGEVDTAVAGKPVVAVALEAVGATLANHVTALLDIPRVSR
jgi:hypothetical protein